MDYFTSLTLIFLVTIKQIIITIFQDCCKNKGEMVTPCAGRFVADLEFRINTMQFYFIEKL
jgi:hypothetical protein